MNRSIMVVLGVVLLVGAWFFVSPLFIDRTVDEDFDFVSADGQLDMPSIMAMPADKRQGMMTDIMDAAATAPDVPAVDSMPANSPQPVASGQFVDADAIHKGSGQATLYALSEGRHLVRFEDFRTTNGPALVVYLAKHPSPTQASHVEDGGFVSLGKLKGNVGNQNYPVPDGVDIAQFNSVVIWCELFGVLFSPAALSES
ncbi:MAG: DM13 domain-containing protein [Woeseiaceae bacterium]